MHDRIMAEAHMEDLNQMDFQTCGFDHIESLDSQFLWQTQPSLLINDSSTSIFIDEHLIEEI